MAKGDQIYTLREFLNQEGLYQHHGIDCGDGTVIHYRKPSETIERTSLATFARGNPIYRKNYPTAFIPDTVVRRAESRLGEKRYNLLFNNCEHFANWCKTGMSYSQQVRDFVPAIANMDIDRLSEPIKQGLRGTDEQNAQMLLDRALGDIKAIWDDLQPRYKQALKEMNSWDRVAREAVKRDREDLAREAIHRKLKYKEEAKNLESKLAQLAKMTENLVSNSQSLNINL
ncbi:MULTISPECIES: lecithin retinol acyltransferase family protein [Spirulina sp. CCY15215]|uniref:lecithin retinol acyltransferase family protein n=1 Tax=Spirulina sp. CCY15215 TaxID=2767591 RepID=UPI0019517050|nr:lecithin retinol acyltransferase family protein [Spirulina major]